MVETHVRPICVLLLLNYISREAELILVATFSTVQLKTTKIAQLEHGTSVVLCGQDQSVSKKTWPFIPCRLSPPPPSGRRR
jgi:hypothetical protein